MTRVLLILCVLLPGLAAARTADEIDLFGAMIDGPEGTPLATATAIGGEPGNIIYVTGAGVGTTTGACVRIRAQGPCHPVADAGALPGYPGLSLVAGKVPQDDMMAKVSALAMTRQPLVANYDPTSGDALTFITQSALGGWERPLAPVKPAGQAGGLVVLRSDTLSRFSTGAPVAHPTNGLVGIIAQAADGSATVLPIGDALRAARAAGVAIQDWMIPADADDSGLPPRVASEIGRMIIFHDYSDLGYLGGFYGPSQGSGFDAGFTATIDFSVWEVDLSGAGGRRIAQGDRTVPLVPSGMGMEAPFNGRPGDHLASCIIHATPSSGGRPVFAMQFWRSVPERYNPNTDSKDYDQAATPMVGWADSETTCADAIRSMGAERLASLANQPVRTSDQPAPTAPAPAPTTEPGVQGDWRRLARWDATGNEALFRDLPGGQVLTAGCTASGELAIAVRPGSSVVTINGLVPSEAADGTRYVLLRTERPGDITIGTTSQAVSVAMTGDLPPCR